MYRSINHYNTDPSGQATYHDSHKITFFLWRKWTRTVECEILAIKKLLLWKITNWTIFILFKRAIKHVCARKKLIVKEKQHFFISTFLHLQHWKNKDNDFLCQLCFLSLYLFWLTTCIFDCFYLQIHVTVMNW